MPWLGSRITDTLEVAPMYKPSRSGFNSSNATYTTSDPMSPDSRPRLTIGLKRYRLLRTVSPV